MLGAGAADADAGVGAGADAGAVADAGASVGAVQVSRVAVSFFFVTSVPVRRDALGGKKLLLTRA